MESKLQELLKLVADFFESESIPYGIVGSVATIKYGEPRLTLDIDVVADIPLGKIARLCERFSMPEYYISEVAVREAVLQKSQFNIISIDTGLKVDVMVPDNSAFGRTQLTRTRMFTDWGSTIQFASPEDVIIKKLEYYKLGESDKHVRDILSVLRCQREKIDREYIRKWVEEMELEAQWEMILEKEKCFLP